MKSRRALTLLLFSGVLYAQAAAGHALNQGYVFVRVEDTAITGRVELNIPDINAALGLSLPTGETVTFADVEPHIGLIRDYVSRRISLSVNGGPSRLPLSDEDGLLNVNFAQYVQVGFALRDLPEEPRLIGIEYDALFDVRPDHRGMLVVETNWKSGTFGEETNVSLVFEPGRELQTLDLTSTSVWTGFAALIRMGTHHIWIGIDHILFLVALLLPAVVRREDGVWRPVGEFRSALIHVIKVVTVFTVAHTITLSLAALQTISLSSRLVESVIAISITIAALDIVYPVFRDRIWWIVFVFGLFHGFGFASVLGEIGIPSNYLVHSLLGFNIGVEIGQVVIVLVIFPVLFLARRYPLYVRALLPAAASVLIAVSLYWFTERAFLVDLPAGAIVNKILALGT